MKAATAELEAPAETGGFAGNHRLRRALQDGLVALSLANLCFLNASFRLLYSADKGYFNKLGPTLPSLLALVVNVAWFALLAWLLIQARRRSPRQLVRVGIDVLFALVCLIPLDFCRRTVFQIPDYKLFLMLIKPVSLAGMAVAVGVFVWQHERISRWLAVLLGVLSPLTFFALARTAFLALGAPEFATSEPYLPPLAPVREHQPRVVWIIFDETDQRLGFEQRPPTVELPAFERLRQEALYATNAFPPGGSTLISMPSLISGRQFSTIAVRNNSDLAGNLADTGVSTNWSQLPSVFDAARALGVNTALVGWYHPYARVLGRSLNFCAWQPFPGFEPARARTFPTALKKQILALSGPPYGRSLYIEACKQSLTAALTVVTNNNYGLTLLHLPPPHKPGIYDAKTGRYVIFGTSGKSGYGHGATGYLNNLGLADHMLGELRAAMEKSGEWDRTWVILSADHSWRDSASYDGIRDLRVPFLVKTPSPTRGQIYPAQMNTVLTHDLILAILTAKVTDQASLVSWLDAHRSTVSPIAHAERE